MSPGPTPPAGPERRTALTRPVLLAALAALVAALLFTIAAAHTTPTGQGRFVRGSAGPVAPFTAPAQSPPPTRPPHRVSALTNSLGVIGAVGALLATLVGVAILLWLLGWLVRNVRIARHGGRRSTATPGDDAAEDDLARRIDAAVGAGLAELEQPGRPVADTIIACWLRLAAASAAAGVQPRPSDTPEETITRLGLTAGVPAKPLVALAELYREARFSRHPIGPAQAEAARAALTQILARLRQDADAPH